MGWEDNEFDWMDDSGYSSDGGMDFGDTSDYTNNLDVTTDDWSGAWSGYGNNDYSGSSDWDFDYYNNINYGANGSGWGGYGYSGVGSSPASGAGSGYSSSNDSSDSDSSSSSDGGW